MTTQAMPMPSGQPKGVVLEPMMGLREKRRMAKGRAAARSIQRTEVEGAWTEMKGMAMLRANPEMSERYIYSDPVGQSTGVGG